MASESIPAENGVPIGAQELPVQTIAEPPIGTVMFGISPAASGPARTAHLVNAIAGCLSDAVDIKKVEQRIEDDAPTVGQQTVDVATLSEWGHSASKRPCLAVASEAGLFLSILIAVAHRSASSGCAQDKATRP